MSMIYEAKLSCGNNLCNNEEGLRKCTRCGSARYCSKECQVEHWKRHKKCCKMLSSSKEMQLRYDKAVYGFLHGKIQRDNGELDQALVTFQESLGIFQEFQHDSYISNCYYSIGHVLRMKKQYDEALVNFRKALEIFREIHDENHIQLCGCYELIGYILSEQDRHDDAFIGYGKALAIRLKIFGEHHTETARSYLYIGISQLRKGDYDGAFISLEKAKTIYTRELGEEHELTAQTNGQLLQLLFLMKNMS